MCFCAFIVEAVCPHVDITRVSLAWSFKHSPQALKLLDGWNIRLHTVFVDGTRRAGPKSDSLMPKTLKENYEKNCESVHGEAVHTKFAKVLMRRSGQAKYSNASLKPDNTYRPWLQEVGTRPLSARKMAIVRSRQRDRTKWIITSRKIPLHCPNDRYHWLSFDWKRGTWSHTNVFLAPVVSLQQMLSSLLYSSCGEWVYNNFKKVVVSH